MTTSAASLPIVILSATAGREAVHPNVHLLPASMFPRTRRAPPPVEDDVDLVGYALLLLLFLAAVWQ
jgi:hypothetical protein